jgi:ribA/ribD-fused uncharacterized protein
MEVIAFRKVREPYGWLGNMSPYPIMYTGETWLTSEALFQALRFDDTSIRREIREQKSPMAAKMVSKKYTDHFIVTPRSIIDLNNMRLVLSLKIEQHPELRKMLIATENAQIIEDCTARQNDSGLFWGAALIGGEWIGKNTLGELWMELRNSL